MHKIDVSTRAKHENARKRTKRTKTHENAQKVYVTSASGDRLKERIENYLHNIYVLVPERDQIIVTLETDGTLRENSLKDYLEGFWEEIFGEDEEKPEWLRS